ncbi:twin-arginine translocation pathway signal [Rhodococcus spelaei]|uniref:Twin-arginine translocation pathway signal n=1 Tax=Rhodococcus spelaei TaxID=2546320 RepID=A0A541B8U2_9NOCA|nr:twin-arginine translocation pathway signal [Rhodococcus spelaei]TQF68739.1 twin-arginine translocation pathway signal [Rhodococcus spelaei]
MNGRTKLTAALAVVSVALAVLAGGLYLTRYRADARVDDTVRAEVRQVAGDGAAALLTYTPETVAADMYAAQQRLTGSFRDYYGRLTDTVIVPAARDKKIAAHSTVTGTGLTSVDADSAVVLVFLTQETTSAAQPQRASATVGARVELQKVGDDWLISNFDAS